VLCAPGLASAAGLAIAPVRLDIAADAHAEVLTVSSQDSAPLEVQVRALAWSQQGTQDSYAPGDDIIVSPPRFTLAAGAQQLVRVYRRGEAPAQERSFRVFIDQLPDAAAPGTVQLPLRLVVPLFVAGTESAQASLQWRAARSDDGLRLEIANRGNVHVRIASLALAPADAAPAAPQPQLVYVLPGATRALSLPRPDWLKGAAMRLRVSGDSDAGPIDARVDLPGLP
jgi:fimbrial chaperone protein